MKYRLYILFSLLFFVVKGYSQYSWTPGTIYLKNGETLTGKVKLSMQSAAPIIPAKDRAYYRKNKESEKQKFKISQIDSVVFTITFELEENGEKLEKMRKATYVPVYLKSKKKHLRFVELLVDGKVRLLGRSVRVNGGGFSPTPVFNGSGGIAHMHYSNYGFFSHNEIFVVKENENPVEINNSSVFKSFKKKAKKYFKDCKALVQKINDKTFKEEDLVEITRYYNENCK